MTLSTKKSIGNGLILILKGMAMGIANKVPGVSGGIIALVFGFYSELIDSFQKLNLNALSRLLNFEFKAFWKYVNGRFLFLIFGGVIISYFSFSLVLDYLLKFYETNVMACFFGMILASIFLIFKKIDKWEKSVIFFCFLGFTFGLLLSFVNPMTENDNLLFIFFCGIVSVSGMTIPGLSGSFLLLIMGNYNLLLVDAVNNLYYLISEFIYFDFSSLFEPYTRRLLVILSIFTLGSLFGLVMFSNFLKLVLIKFPNQTISTIIGFISGTIILAYPWKAKEYLYDEYGNFILNSVGKESVTNFQYYLPDLNKLETYIEFSSIIFGVMFILVLNYYEEKRTN